MSLKYKCPESEGTTGSITLLVLTCAGLSRHAVGLSLIVSVLVLETHQVRVGLRAEASSDADDVLVGRVHHLLHLFKTHKLFTVIHRLSFYF